MGPRRRREVDEEVRGRRAEGGFARRKSEMCSGTFNNPSMKLLVIRDAIPDTPDLITHPPGCCLISYSRYFPYFSISFSFSFSLVYSVWFLFAIHVSSLSFFSLHELFTGSLILSASVSPRFHALFISTVIADNVVEPENNIGVVASLYCDVVIMYLRRFGCVTIVEIGVIVNAMIKTVMATIAETVWRCCTSLIWIYVALSKRTCRNLHCIFLTLYPCAPMSNIIIMTTMIIDI